MDNENDKTVAVRGVDGGTQTLSISRAPDTQKLSIDMDVLSLDVALNLIESAKREIESRFRFMRAQELALEAVQRQQIAVVASDVMRRGPRGV
jgi:hypothetical protein